MNIQPTGNISFKANLYYKDRQLKKGISDSTDIKDCGNSDTSIFVTGISSHSNGYNSENRVSFTLENPLFGTSDFRDAYTPSKFNSYNPILSATGAEDFLYNLFTHKGYIKYFEEKTLKNTLLQKANDIAESNLCSSDKPKSTNVVDIFKEHLKTVSKTNFLDLTQERTEQLCEAAQRLNDEIVYEGTGKLLNQKG